MELCSLEQRQPWGNLTGALQHLPGVTEHMEPGFLLKSMVSGTKSQYAKQEQAAQ